MSSDIITGVGSAVSASLYCTVADLRPTSNTPTTGTRWPELMVTTTQAADNRLTTLITEASNELDRLTGDHFATSSYAYAASSSPDYGLLVIDGPRPDGFGGGGKMLWVPKRVQSITNVYYMQPSTNATPILLSTTLYKAHSSLNDPDGFDAIEIYGRPLDDSLTGWATGSSWPTWPRSVGLDGSFGWSAVPEPVAKATAFLVCDMVGNKNLPPQAMSYQTGGVRFDRGQTKPTGIPYVDGVIAQYGRSRATVEVV